MSLHDFELKKSLGEGKFGQVYQAFHKATGFWVAIKKISKSVIKSNKLRSKLLLKKVTIIVAVTFLNM